MSTTKEQRAHWRSVCDIERRSSFSYLECGDVLRILADLDDAEREVKVLREALLDLVETQTMGAMERARTALDKVKS